MHNTMTTFAVIQSVDGLFEGYLDTTCGFHADRAAALQHVRQCLDIYRADDMCVSIALGEDSARVTMTNNPDDYNARVPQDMGHDEWVSENSASVETFHVVEVASSAEWLTWDQLDATLGCFTNSRSLVARVSEDLMAHDNPSTALEQLREFTADVRQSDSACIDAEDCTLHAFRVPKKVQ